MSIINEYKLLTPPLNHLLAQIFVGQLLTPLRDGPYMLKEAWLKEDGLKAWLDVEGPFCWMRNWFQQKICV